MNMKRFLSILLVLAMTVGLVPGAAFADGAENAETKTITQTNTTATMTISVTVPEKSAVSYIDANGEEKQTGTDYNNVRATIVNWGAVDTESWWVVDEDVTIAERIVVSGRVNLILCDGATLTANKGITFASNEYSLTVYGQTKGTGALVAAGGSGQAGIGGGSLYDDVGSVGTVTINGGTVTATGGENAAGIGGGIETDGKTVTINGGTVTATGGNKGAGIGGGSYCGGGTVNINGGTVTAKATGEDPGTAIGAGYSGTGCTINVSEGMIAVAGSSAADAAATAANGLNDKKWVYIEKETPLTAIAYLDWNSETKAFETKTLDPTNTTFTRVRPYTTTTWSAGWYVVDKDVTITNQIVVEGDINLILTDGATLTASKGITFYNFLTKFTVYGQSAGTGKLTSGEPVFGRSNFVVMTFNGGVIDISVGEDAGNTSDAPIGAKEIIVNGGSVSGTSANCYGIDASSVTIHGGTVNAISTNSGGSYAKGMSSSSITVNGGVLNTYGSYRAIDCSGGDITVNGGSLTARSETRAIFANLTVTGGTVLAEGMKGSNNGGDGVYGNVEVSGGSVTVIGGDGGDGQNGKAISGSVTLGTGIQVKAGDAETETFVTDYVENHNNYRWAKIANFHTHTLTNYALTKTNAENDTITATCTNDDEKCTLEAPDHQAKLVILAPTEGGGAATLTGAADFDVTAANIEYYKGNDKLDAAPTEDGFFKAQIAVGGETAYVTYGVNEIVKDTAFNASTAHGDFTVPAVATANATVTIETTPDTGYELKEINVTKESDNSAVASSKNGNNGTFTMPAEKVIVSAEFQKINYTITKSEMTNGSVTVAATAQMDDTVAVTVTPATGYELETLKYGDTDITATEGVYSFTMPASNVTISATFKLHDYNITKSEMTNGSLTVAATAKMGDPVEITVAPDAGYQLSELTFNNTAITADGEGKYKFTMPAENVTVSATFEKRDVGVKLVVNKDSVDAAKQASCKAALLTTEYNAAEAGFTRTLGEKFILRVDSDENYDFTIAGTTALNFRQLTKTEKQSYLAAHPDTEASTQLFEVTMPAVASGDLTVTVTFLEIKNYTVLYQPGETTNTVWCKIGSGEKSFQLEMNPDAQMGNVKTFALNVSMTSAPQKIAFGTAELVANATMTDVIVKASTAAAGTWQEIDSDKFLVIGGNARTVIAAFTPNNTPYEVNAADVKSLPEGTQYQIAVCGVGQAGTVKAPAAPTAPTGKDFAGWGYRSEPANGEDTYNAGADISITDDAIFGAVWTPATSTVTVDLKGGDIAGETDNVTISEVPYNQAIKDALQNLLPTKNGFALDGWTVNKSVTEGGKFFSRGSDFDPNTNITSDLGLNAKWKHVHSYTCVPLSYFGDALAAYLDYAPYIHVRFCGCGDVELEAHTFRNGVCTGCGYEKQGTDTATLNVSYWKDGAQWMSEVPRTGLKKNEEVTVSAFWKIGDYQFSKWQYRFNNGDSWKDLAADTMVGFLIPASMQVRALYTEVQVKPQVSLSASKYVTAEQGYNWDTVLFQMEYKLPKDCTYVDAGIRMGDNQGISFYSLKKRKVSAFETAFNFITSDPISFAVDSLTSDPDYIIEKREDNVLDTMSAATLAKYMMENKPINIPEYEPIYWQANPATKGRSGSVNTLTPLKFIQKNNGNHYIYGVAYLRFKDSTGEHTIYTEAIPVTRNTIPHQNTVTATYNTPN